ncbi:efflux RND transporter periplasmic adaptor subunit [Methylobacterium sp. JK268]
MEPQSAAADGDRGSRDHGGVAPGSATVDVGYRTSISRAIRLPTIVLGGVCLMGGCVWSMRDTLLPPTEAVIRPYLVLMGLATGAAPEASTRSSDQAEVATQVDPNVVILNAAGQASLRLASGQATTRRILQPVRAPGMVAFDERRVAHVKPRTPGRVTSLAVQPGDTVRAGQTLATLDAAGVLDARNGLSEAKASLAEAQATEAVAETNLKRGLDLLKVGSVAQSEADRRRVDLAKAHAATLSAQSKVELFTAQYERLAPEAGAAPGTSAIVAPLDGVVTTAGITLGEVVDTGRDAFTVADPSRVQVLASLYGSDMTAVKAGDAASVRAAPSRPRLDGRVRSVNAAVDPASNTAPARIEIDNSAGLLRANMFVSVEIAADLDREGVTIPASAVQQTQDGLIAFVRTGEERFEKRTLTLGLQRPDWVEVVEGVADGETVATDGSFGLKAILMRGLLGSTD